MIDQNTIDRIIDAAQIQDVVGDYIALKKRGTNLLGLCPFHNEKTPSFMVSPAKGIFKCFGCGKGGNAIHFVMNHEQISYYDALKVIAKKYNIEVKERELSPEEIAVRNDRESMLLVNEFAQKYFTHTLQHHIDGKSIGLGYFRERGFRDDIIAKFQLGYSLDIRDAFTQTALKEGYNKDFLIKTGLTLEGENNYLADRFRGRVMFPVHSLSGKVVAFGGRILKKDDKLAKYVNSPESDIYRKSNELYGIYFAKSSILQQDKCFLVEGYTDVISMHQNGIENVVASSGTALTPQQIRLIHRFTENITVIFDGDKAGIKAAIRGIDLLLEEGMNIKVLLLPDGDDPDSFAKKHNSSDFIEFVERESSDFLRFKTKLLMEDAGNDPVKRAGLVLDIVKSIAIIPNAAVRAEYVKECSSILNVEEQMLYYEINKLKSNEQNKYPNRLPESNTNTEKLPSESQIATLGSNSKFDIEERNIVQALLKNGNEKIVFENDQKTHHTDVANYIFMELDLDELTFENILYQKIINEYKAAMNREDFSSERYFLHHADEEISMLAADLISEKYQLSKIHTKKKRDENPNLANSKYQLNSQKTKSKKEEEQAIQLLETISRLIFEYKNSLVINMIKQKLLEIKSASEAKDNQKIGILMTEMSGLEEIKRKLSKTLGDRIILKL